MSVHPRYSGLSADQFLGRILVDIARLDEGVLVTLRPVVRRSRGAGSADGHAGSVDTPPATDEYVGDLLYDVGALTDDELGELSWRVATALELGKRSA